MLDRPLVFVDPETAGEPGTVRAEHEFDALDAHPAFDLDIYNILKRFFDNPRNSMAVMPLAG